MRSIVTAVNSLRGPCKEPVRDLWAKRVGVPAQNMPSDRPDRAPMENAKAPGLIPGAFLRMTFLDAVERRPNVLEDLADDRAEEDERHDHDDRNEGQKQTVLYERLAFLIFAVEPSEKSPDDLNHSFAIPPFLGDWLRQRRCHIAP